jgi:hypothetical protein
MPRDATNTPASHTSALGELFIADERERMQGEVYEKNGVYDLET